MSGQLLYAGRRVIAACHAGRPVSLVVNGVIPVRCLFFDPLEGSPRPEWTIQGGWSVEHVTDDSSHPGFALPPDQGDHLTVQDWGSIALALHLPGGGHVRVTAMYTNARAVSSGNFPTVTCSADPGTRVEWHGSADWAWEEMHADFTIPKDTPDFTITLSSHGWCRYAWIAVTAI